LSLEAIRWIRFLLRLISLQAFTIFLSFLTILVSRSLRSFSPRPFSRSFLRRVSLRRSISVTLSMSLITRSLWISSSTNPSSSSMLSTMLLTRKSPCLSSRPIPTMSFTEVSTLKTASVISHSPSSIFLAISTSSSRLSSDTRPISRRYIFTGSPVRATPGSRDSSSSSSSSLASAASSTVFLRMIFSPLSVSMMSMFFSPKSMMISSIWSDDTMSEGSISLTSS